MNQNPHSVWAFLRKLFQASTGSFTLQDLASRYENELVPYDFVYTFTPKGKKSFQARLQFDRGNFCHLFSLASMVKDTGADYAEFSGMQGWRNIQQGRITYSTLKRMNPTQFDYYHKEQLMFDQLVQTLENPKAVLYDPAKNKDSKLEADVLLYGQYGPQVVHIALSQDRDGTWFPRSYFVREESRDREYPTKYIYGMPSLKASVKKKRTGGR